MAGSRYLPFAGRLLIGGLFMMSGLTKITGFAATAGAVAAVGLPFASLGAVVAVVVEFGLGLLMVIGFQARLVAAALAVWCVVTAVLFHSNFADPNAMINFLKNLMIVGGLLQIMHFGAGAFSADAARSARK